jgi:hypothetical protein
MVPPGTTWKVDSARMLVVDRLAPNEDPEPTAGESPALQHCEALPLKGLLKAKVLKGHIRRLRAP